MAYLSNFQKLKINLMLTDKDISYAYKDFLREIKSKDNALYKGENK